MNVESILREVLGERAAQRILSELDPLVQDLQTLGWKELRPWADFFAVFKPPQWQFKHLEQRVVTNFLHYRTNYVHVSLAVLALNVLLAPLILLTVVAVAALWVYLFAMQRRAIVIGEHVLDGKKKLTLFVSLALFLLVITGTLQRLLWATFYAVVLCGAHMVFRPRSVSSKMNRVYDEMKLSGYSSVFEFASGETKSSSDIRGARSSSDDLEDPSLSSSEGMRRRAK